MMSFIVPAHNEQAGIGRTLQAIHESARVVGQPYEIIVVDDASTDSTAEIARQHQATVVPVNHRQIAATRNSGARAAHGDRLFFVDADTTINPRVVTSALHCMDKGAAGGGAPARFEGDVPLFAKLLIWWLGWFMRLGEMSGGAFLFCRREAFYAVGGFDERLFGGEDAALSLALKREGRFVVLWESVLTSGRRARGMPGLQMLNALIRMAFFPKMLAQRSSVEKIWYDSNREGDGEISSSLAVQVSNAAALLIMIVLVTLPVWIIPWPQVLIASPLGAVRFVAGIILAHVGLVLWPCAYFLTRSLFRQKRWMERAKSAALIALCLWYAWESTRGVLWFWIRLGHWLTHFYHG